jgi:hypothetical protein
MNPKHAVACCAFILLIWGCAGLKETKIQPPLPAHAPTADPASVVENLEQINRDLVSFKGIGTIKIWKPNGLQSTRIAWAGYLPQKLRLEILGIAGRPLSSVAFDGNRFYLSLHTENKFYQKQTRNANLKRLISIPITIPDTLTVLAGRVPLWENASVSLTAIHKQSPYVLILKKKWFKNQTARIYLRDDLHTVDQFELYGSRDELRYRVKYLERKRYDRYQLPTLIQISDDQQNRIQIKVERIWPDAEISSEIFHLKPPK